MAATRLSIYNRALRYLGERRLADLNEERESRRLLDEVYNDNGIEDCLEEAQWHFAMRTIQIDYDPAVTPSYGYRRAFVKPDDWVLTSGLCVDEYFREPLTRYVDEAAYWYADEDTLYVRYVSNDAGYGLNLAGWPNSFYRFVAAHFAAEIALKLTGDAATERTIFALRQKYLDDAKNRAAMALPTSFPARGTWVRARQRYGGRRDDGGSRGSLIG